MRKFMKITIIMKVEPTWTAVRIPGKVRYDVADEIHYFPQIRYISGMNESGGLC